MTFESLGLISPLLTALSKTGYSEPSPIQQKAIPPILDGSDVMAAAQTGTGKTAAFTLPLLQRLHDSGQSARSNHTRALVLTPTRELAAQVAENVKNYGRDLKLRYNLVYGGVKINPQMMQLRRGTDVLIATPGRLLDLYQQNAIKFNQLEVLVLDEADRMLDMGFIHDIKKIMALLPKKRQTLMFSATFSDDIRQLARSLVDNPVEVSVTPPNTTVERIDQRVHPVDKSQKTKLLVHLLKQHNWFQVLVFCRTKHGANRLTTNLNKKGISAAAIHGNKSQNVRTRALTDFKAGDLQVLVATDIAARGIDIADLPYVINFDLPHVAEDYVHRIGRTGRAGKSGLALSLVSADEAKQLASIESLIKLSITRDIITGFEPLQNLPVLKHKSKPKRPKKNKPKTPVSESTRAEAKPAAKPRRRRRNVANASKRNAADKA
ncbi:DEAD/DEAH box helicase [Aestuariibacter salexigens]|uniref:DEAD/DEAH box helicase n=1 Tax=Aestuariibacter salexigens TaxID=226010 RepID=UPI000414A0F7|nr:DEAD/DEAH box helicase [Aestuariibacter salexigens]